MCLLLGHQEDHIAQSNLLPVYPDLLQLHLCIGEFQNRLYRIQRMCSFVFVVFVYPEKMI